jgi:hypothetical protein
LTAPCHSRAGEAGSEAGNGGRGGLALTRCLGVVIDSLSPTLQPGCECGRKFKQIADARPDLTIPETIPVFYRHRYPLELGQLQKIAMLVLWMMTQQ